MLTDHQKRHNITDPWQEAIEPWVENWETGEGVSITQIGTMGLDVPTQQLNRGVEMRIAKVLKRLKWVRKKKRVDGKLGWRWFRS